MACFNKNKPILHKINYTTTPYPKPNITNKSLISSGPYPAAHLTGKIAPSPKMLQDSLKLKGTKLHQKFNAKVGVLKKKRTKNHHENLMISCQSIMIEKWNFNAFFFGNFNSFFCWKMWFCTVFKRWYYANDRFIMQWWIY